LSNVTILEAEGGEYSLQVVIVLGRATLDFHYCC